MWLSTVFIPIQELLNIMYLVVVYRMHVTDNSNPPINTLSYTSILLHCNLIGCEILYYDIILLNRTQRTLTDLSSFDNLGRVFFCHFMSLSSFRFHFGMDGWMNKVDFG